MLNTQRQNNIVQTNVVAKNLFQGGGRGVFPAPFPSLPLLPPFPCVSIQIKLPWRC